MAQKDKSRYYQALKNAGVEFSKHYREYSTEELAAAYQQLMEDQGTPDRPVEHHEPPAIDDSPVDPEAAAFYGMKTNPVPEPQPSRAEVPVAGPNPNEMAGERLNSQAPDEPIRVDEQGRVWFQEEVRKPAYPKPRGRRVLQYVDTGTKEVQTKVGDYTETFEVAGDEHRVAQVKITLPSYQVGIYKDPRFPFRIYVYNDVQGFDLFEVEKYFGGRELVPATVKRIYVSNVLAYDIRSVVQTIQREYRQLQLAGKV